MVYWDFYKFYCFLVGGACKSAQAEGPPSVIEIEIEIVENVLLQKFKFLEPFYQQAFAFNE